MIRNHNLSIDTAAARGQNINTSPEDLSDESDDDLSPSPIIDENIDFSLVYALHNFKATVEGQTTVDKGDSLNLLDDSNSYWWLVKVVKTEEVGYIPAENIETPYERLARLNKHRNVTLSSSLNNTEEDNLLNDQKKYQGRKVVFFTSPEFIETTTQEKVEIDEPVEENRNVNQETATSHSVSTQVDENINPYTLREFTSPTPTGQNGQQDGLHRQKYGYPAEQQHGLSISNPTTPTTEISKNAVKKGIFKSLFKWKKRATQSKTNHNTGTTSANGTNSTPRPSIDSQQSSPKQVLHEYCVIRVFAGQNLPTNFQSKTILLHKNSTTTSFIKQAIQRFKLDDGNFDNYYISIKEINKDEKYLIPDQNPFEIFSQLISYYSITLPSIRRSSISSNLSDDETIKKLQLHDGPNTVCLCLNKKTKVGEKKLRVRVLIYPDDLPVSLRSTKVTESRTSMSVPKHLAEKAARRRSKEEAKPKEKSLIVTANATVRQVIEKAMDKIGITEGIVDDGGIYDDEKLRYQLMIIVNGEEKFINPNANIISVYQSPPDLRHFSMDSIDSQSSLALDYRPDESIFVLRLLRPEERQQRAMPSAEEVKRYTQDVRMLGTTNQQSIDREDALVKKHLIEQQRQYSQARQKSIISARKNQEQGVDIVTDMGAIRSSRVFGNRVRYSFISAGGDTFDISKLIEDMWGDDELLNINDQDEQSSLDQNNESADSLAVNAKKQRRRSTTQEVDILEKLMINQDNDELPEDKKVKIEQVLSKVKAGHYENGNVPSITSALRNRRNNNANDINESPQTLQYKHDTSINNVVNNVNGRNESPQTLQYRHDISVNHVINNVNGRNESPQTLQSRHDISINNVINNVNGRNELSPTSQSKHDISINNGDMTNDLLPNTTNNNLFQNMDDNQSIIGSTASLLENDWVLSDDFGLQELLVLVRSGVNMLEIKQRRRSGWHLHDDPEKILERINPADIRDEIRSVFEGVNDELDILELELDRIMDDAIRVF
ncbi:21855_t:CDS:2 [Cetraspora pellucida]|uniref:21855_t:CDS:1 n=1 Tax=Cetraspora pellucida TaxID=1433469 RepID=A0A9N8YUF2_9GLOM|nr:21855_t:CDS:2 [Cetraspora pellucida]